MVTEHMVFHKKSILNVFSVTDLVLMPRYTMFKETDTVLASMNPHTSAAGMKQANPQTITKLQIMIHVPNKRSKTEHNASMKLGGVVCSKSKGCKWQVIGLRKSLNVILRTSSF